jgi:hypothetical protein
VNSALSPAHLDKEGKFVGSQGEVVGRVLPNGTVAIDTKAVPGIPANDNEPRLCPMPRPDKKGERGRDYEDYVKSFVNPLPYTTPRAVGFQLPNPEENSKLVYYDDCQHSTGTMIEAKGPTYAKLLTYDWGKWSLTNDWLEQSGAQIAAAEKRPVRWYFAEPEAAEFAREIFNKAEGGRERIEIVVLPWSGSRQMNEHEYAYDIRSGWRGRPESPASIGTKFLNMLDALSGIDPTFGNWRVIDALGKASRPLAEVRPNIAAIVEKNVARDDYGPSPRRGYHAAAMAGKFKDPRSTTFSVDAGGQFDSETHLEFGSWNVRPDPAIVTYPLYKAALLAINAIWRAPWACAYAFKLDYDKFPLIPGVPLFPFSRFHIPWIAYLSPALAVRFALPADILTERAPDGGLLMTATVERLDPTNPEHLRRARILAGALMARTGYRPSRPVG